MIQKKEAFTPTIPLPPSESSLNNENFTATGQSITQHCKSYTFDLHDGGRRTVRIIGTPGFGDTRSTDQHDQNIEHILQYINILTHLNAICFLLKPNASRLISKRRIRSVSTVNHFEYENSWSTSVKESNRLIDYIKTKLIVYRMENGWQSIKYAQFEISYMIRPILEAIRNILRNTILWNTTQSNQQIEQTSKPLPFSASRCHSCKGDPKKNGNSRHVEMYDQASAIFSHFLIHKAFARKDDPFLTGFREMIAEETYSCTSRAPNDFNRLLLQELSDIGNKYKQETQTMKSVDASIDLPAIYELISIMSAIRLVHEQLVAVKRRHRMTIEQYDIMHSLLFIYQFKMHQQFYNVNYYLLEKQNRSINLFYQSDPI
ncbi:unnamed protein product [Rotaria magnacalcarata]|uniref:Uncharacterized protein n=1 Tax=Rotaria magnacalcarata TaxID=392030 RepID=A0A8S3EV08_9BILA|nr:unnamed protein product [Rotaria magnacalcarata]